MIINDDLEATIARLDDQAAIHDLIMRFADVVTRGDVDAFPGLWATDATWVIGGPTKQPFERRASGTKDITALFRTLREERDYFIHLISPGVIEVDGDTATARSNCHESARGPDNFYRTNGIWDDTFRRSGDGWVFAGRVYTYLWLDLSPYSGDVAWAGQQG